MPTDPIRLKHPIVLIHGLGARNSYGPFDYFWGLPQLLRNAGNQLMVANLTSWQMIEKRAEQLKEQIEIAFPEGKVNLVGHSMGGLDARYLTSALGFSERVASVTTIGTPNRGTIMADIASGVVPSPAFNAANKFLALLESSTEPFKQVSTKHCNEEFWEKTPNAPGVAYFSATSAISDPVMRTALPIFWLSHRIVNKYEGDNDGFVSVESAKWGDHICTYIGDHYGQIGQFLGRSRGLDYLAFYNEIFGHLKKQGM